MFLRYDLSMNHKDGVMIFRAESVHWLSKVAKNSKKLFIAKSPLSQLCMAGVMCLFNEAVESGFPTKSLESL